jgi:hypothetical protein
MYTILHLFQGCHLCEIELEPNGNQIDTSASIELANMFLLEKKDQRKAVGMSSNIEEKHLFIKSKPFICCIIRDSTTHDT